jgi:hypothetical protein
MPLQPSSLKPNLHPFPDRLAISQLMIPSGPLVFAPKAWPMRPEFRHQTAVKRVEQGPDNVLSCCSARELQVDSVRVGWM